MKTLATTIAASFLVLFILTTLVPYPPARETALHSGFSSDLIETGLQYTFERRFFSWGWIALELTLLYVLVFTSLSRRWADRWLAWTGGRRVLAVMGMGLAYVLIQEVLYLPIGIGQHYHSAAWGMAKLRLLGWLRDHYLAFGINLVWEAIILAGFYGLLIGFPRTWWLLAPIGGSALGIAYAFLAPIAINPLFNDFTPLAQSPWKDQDQHLRRLIAKAGVPVEEILVMDASTQSNHTNAYFTGFGSTRRIVLYDNLLKQHSEAEIESILAHELGHWMHDHIVKGILLSTLAALLGCFVLDRFLRAAMLRSPWRLQSIADPAGLPLLLLLVFLGGWITMPIGNAVSRHFERQADHMALELAGQPDVFIECEKKLATDNKSNVAPTPWNVWLYASHPPTVERIRMAEEWKTELSTKDTK